MLEYTLIRSARKTLCLEIKDLKLIVRAPKTATRKDIQRFLDDHEDWINSHLARQKLRLEAHPEPDENERQALIEKARDCIPDKVYYYSKLMGLSPAAVTITSARGRFGSCSSKGRICFSWRLMSYPEDAIDYVVVHELAHLKYMDHGKDFYALIESVLPDYKKRRALLKK